MIVFRRLVLAGQVVCPVAHGVLGEFWAEVWRGDLDSVGGGRIVASTMLLASTNGQIWPTGDW